MKSKIITGILFLFIIANFYLLQADLINVNANGGAQFLSIQEAINVASNGDTILVHPDTYYENINFNGKNIVVASLYLTTGNKDYINDTVINGNHNGVVVTFENGETSSAILKGFTITNGYAEYGGGIKCKNTSKPVIDHLIISGNIATDDGGGVACYNNSSMKISNCIFNDNIANDNGGGIFLNHSKGLIDNCLFSDNISNGGSSAIDCWSSDPLIINCTLVNNISYSWATIGIWDTSSPNIIDCIVSNNTGSGFVFHSQSQATVEYCNCYENSYGSFSGSVPQGLGTIIQVNANNDPCDEFYNIFIDPKLNDTVNSNYVLLPTSPCIDAGIPDTTGLNLPQYDLDGNLRIVDGNGDGIAIIDMGCYESDGMNYNVFTRITVGDIVNDAGKSKGCSWADFNNDGHIDLFVTNAENQNNYLYCNNGDETFAKITEGPVVNDGGDSRGGGSWGDYDNDGDLDLFVSNRLQDNFLYSNNGDGTFTKIINGDIVNDGGNSRGTSWGDYDNDGYLDLFVSNDGGNNFLYKNNCDGTFTKITDETITNNGGVSVGCVWGDYDNDGDLDIFVSNFWDDNNFLYSNNGNDNNWINIKCVGTLSNKSAIGTKVRVKTTLAGNPVWQMREISSLSGYSSQNSMNAMFGLADNTTIDSLIINWPSGIEQVLTNITPNQFIIITEPYSPVGQIHLAIPTIHALPGDTVLVPMNVQFPQDSTFTSAEIQVGGYLGSLEFVELVADSCLIGDAGWLYESNESDSLNTLWMAGSEPISGEDVLIRMKFIIPDTAAGFIPITLINAIFDTGILPVDLHSGGNNVVTPIYGDVDFNGLVQAYDASMILKYLAGYIFLDDLQLSVADVSLDSTVSALDATLVLQYGVGIIDTLPYQPGASYIANGDITMEDQVYTGDPIDVPIIITNAENIYSFEGMIHFDTECLMLSDVYWSDYLDGFFIWTDVEGGEFKLVGSGALPYEEYGVMATIRFYPKDGFNNYDSTTVFFRNMRWNENDTIHNIAASVITNNFGVNNPQEPDLILRQNNPNPFAYNTKIQYSIPLPSFVSLKIYNIRGELVADLVDEFKAKGLYDVSWNGKDTYGKSVVNGMYFYKFNSSDKEIVKRMILLR